MEVRLCSAYAHCSLSRSRWSFKPSDSRLSASVSICRTRSRLSVPISDSSLPSRRAVIAAMGGILSEVGAVQMVGGNLAGETRMLTTAIMMHVGMGEFEAAMGLGTMLVGVGLLGTLLGVRANLAAFSDLETGLIMAAYYVGYIAGTILAPRIIRNVGHIRAFAAFEPEPGLKFDQIYEVYSQRFHRAAQSDRPWQPAILCAHRYK